MSPGLTSLPFSVTGGPLNVCEIMGLCELQLTGGKIIIIWGNEVCLYLEYEKKNGQMFCFKST